MDRKQRQDWIGKRVKNEHGKIGVIHYVSETGTAHVEFLDYHGDNDFAILVIPVVSLERVTTPALSSPPSSADTP